MTWVNLRQSIDNQLRQRSRKQQVRQWQRATTLRVSQWADKHRRLSQESSAEPGRWETGRAPYQRAIMDAFNDDNIHTIVVMCSAQIGKTEILNNIIGYLITQEPSPILVLQPTLEMAEVWSKDRLAPMLRDTPVLRDKVRDPRSRDSGNTLLHKQFSGGHVSIVGANSPAGLASRPIRVVLCDEIDKYPASAGSEGDPIHLARKRTTTFPLRKLVLTSTPTLQGLSRIEAAFETSDKRRFFVPCPHCQTFQILVWENMHWPEGKPNRAHMICTHCQRRIRHRHKAKLLAQGQWRAEGKSSGIAGFAINELYSPWVTWAEMAASFVEAKQLPETYKTWVNTSLGKCWQEHESCVEAETLYQRREEYGHAVPQKAVLLTAGVDVQDDRLEIETVAWGDREESWSMRYDVLYGSPAQESVWQQLEAVLTRRFTHESGVPLMIRGACIDTGGHHTSAVYRFCQHHPQIFAIKGSSQMGKPIVSRPTRSNLSKINLYALGTDTAKAMIYSRLEIPAAGPGFCHFPKSDTLGEYSADWEYFRQLTAEKQVTRTVKGKVVRRFEKPSGVRNEALDVRVYATAALYILNPRLQPLPAQPHAAVEKQSEPQRRKDPFHYNIRREKSWLNLPDGPWLKLPDDEPWL